MSPTVILSIYIDYIYYFYNNLYLILLYTYVHGLFYLWATLPEISILNHIFYIVYISYYTLLTIYFSVS